MTETYKSIIIDKYLEAIDTGTQCSKEITFLIPYHLLKEMCYVYLFEQRVSPDFLHPDLSGVKLSHILIHHRLQVHGTIETALQFPEQRH